MAYALARARRLGRAAELPADAIVMASFGDATVNHATALAAFNTARYGARVGLPMPTTSSSLPKLSGDAPIWRVTSRPKWSNG